MKKILGLSVAVNCGKFHDLILHSCCELSCVLVYVYYYTQLGVNVNSKFKNKRKYFLSQPGSDHFPANVARVYPWGNTPPATHRREYSEYLKKLKR